MIFQKQQRRTCQAGKRSSNLFPNTKTTIRYMSELLEKEELTIALKKCPEWEYELKYITRTIEFEEFMEGIDFVNNVGEIADDAQHHPDIMIKHTKVTIKLTTHDVGGVTDLDIQLAQRIDNLVD
jgi:4a-hydroxytetrahydrobiopterin dehydratase